MREHSSLVVFWFQFILLNLGQRFAQVDSIGAKMNHFECENLSKRLEFLVLKVIVPHRPHLVSEATALSTEPQPLPR